METTYFETPEDGAYGLKLSIGDFISDWLEKHEVHDEYQRTYIWRYIVNDGWQFFHDELIEYFLKCNDRYIVHDDESITYKCSM